MSAPRNKPKAIPMDRLRGAKRPAIGKLELPFDYDLAEAFDAAEQEVAVAERDLAAQRRDPELTAAKHRLDAARAARNAALEALKPSVHRFMFRAMPLDDFDALLLLHKPTGEQRERFGQDTAYNAETFCPAIVAASLVWTGTGDEEWPKGEATPTHPAYTEAEIMALWHPAEPGDDDDGDPNNFGPAELEALFQTAMATCRTRRQVDLGKAAAR